MIAWMVGSTFALAVQLAFSPPDARLTPADSVRTFKYVRSAQASFESYRRNRLPYGESSSGLDCDARVGRYCYWREDDADDEGPPPEPASIRIRRSALIDLLDSAAHLLPGDPWIAGQRVRYLVEAERTDDALAAASQCAADGWWCAALGGYAAHVGARFSLADSLFETALGAMAPARRCEWTDIHEVVDGDLARRVEHAPCAGREALARRIFWLGAPLWSVAQTDLLTEHLARLTQIRLVERAASTEGTPSAPDSRALVLRYGWSRWFTRSDPLVGSPYDVPVTGHDDGTAYYFLPSARMLDAGPDASPDWRLDDAHAISGYAPSYARTIHEIPAQVAAFRRGESTLVVGAWDVRGDTTLAGRALDAALVLAAPNEVRAAARAAGQGSVGRIQATARLDTGWVSLELLAAKERRAGRVRAGVVERAHGRLAMSDLLVYAPGDGPVEDLAAAADSALAGDAVPSGRAIGVFYETYGIAPQGEHLRVALSLEQIEIGWRQRAAERLHLADPPAVIRIQWDETAHPRDGVAARGQRVDLSRVRPGRYRLVVRATADDGATVSSSHELEVRNR